MGYQLSVISYQLSTPLDIHKNKKGQPQGLPLRMMLVGATLVVALLKLII
jgi:hypothetical protein